MKRCTSHSEINLRQVEEKNLNNRLRLIRIPSSSTSVYSRFLKLIILGRERSMTNHNLAQVRHVIAVAAGKGGVGKSTLAFNLALSLAELGASVGVMDADLYGPSLRKMLPEDVPPTQNPEVHERLIPGVSRGIKLISMAYFLQEGDPASVRAPIANGIIKQFIHLVDWGSLDYLVIDFPPGTGDIQLTLIQEGALSGALIVTTPQEIALLDVAKACAMFSQMQVPVIGMVENMSYFSTPDGAIHYPFGQGGGEKFARENGMYFLGRVPIDPEVSRCCDQGLSIFTESPLSPAAAALKQIAAKTVEQLESFEKLQEGQLKNFDLQWQR
jgi:ATP-binding protein involved in chromosome partitioning